MYNHISSNRNRTVFLMISFFIFFVLVGYALSYYYSDPSILWFAVIFSVFMNWFSYFFSDKIALATTGARPAREENDIEERQIVNMVENLCITGGLPTPKVYVIDDPSPNAFATGRNPKNATVTVTTGLMKLLDKSEMEGVIAHELSHIKNYDILLSTVVVTLVGAITLIGDMFIRTSWMRSSDSNDNKNNPLAIAAIIFVLLSPLFAQLIQLAISRRREFLADASGALLTRYPEGLAKALEKIEATARPMKRANRATAHLFISNPFADKISGLFSTHPKTSERIKALREMGN